MHHHDNVNAICVIIRRIIHFFFIFFCFAVVVWFPSSRSLLLVQLWLGFYQKSPLRYRVKWKCLQNTLFSLCVFDFCLTLVNVVLVTKQNKRIHSIINFYSKKKSMNLFFHCRFLSIKTRWTTISYFTRKSRCVTFAHRKDNVRHLINANSFEIFFLKTIVVPDTTNDSMKRWWIEVLSLFFFTNTIAIVEIQCVKEKMFEKICQKIHEAENVLEEDFSCFLFGLNTKISLMIDEFEMMNQIKY